MGKVLAFEVGQGLDPAPVGRWSLCARLQFPEPWTTERKMIELKVPDMTCGHCVSTITKAVKELDAAAKVEVSLPEHRVRVDSKASKEDLVRSIAEAGYTPEAV